MMNNKHEPILDAEKLEEAPAPDDTTQNVDDKKTPPEKRNFKFHFFLTLILGVGTWAFITYSPIAKAWKVDWYDYTHQSRNDEIIPALKSSQVDSAPEPVVEEPKPMAETPEPIIADDTPIFEDTPPLTQVEPPAVMTAESLSDLTDMIASLQTQLATIQGNMSQMYAQQMQQGKQQVSAQLSTLLYKASSPNSRIEDAATAWKSISLLPLLEDDRRAQAEQAWQDLQGLNVDIQAMSDAVVANLRALAEKLQPEALAEMVESVDNLVDEYATTDTPNTWLDWLKGQFQLSKVNEHAIAISQDPYADLKTLMVQLDQLSSRLRSGQWQQLPDLDSLNHQLEQYGLNSNFSPDMVEQLKQTQETWQQQAQAWMEQL